MAGEYRLIRKLGEGGFGAVYEARHPVLKRRAAVKVLHQVGHKGSNSVLRFISEAQAVNQIRSRHIVDVFSFGTLADGRHFFVMDLLSGEPLDRCLDREKRLDVSSALQLLRPIAEALDAAHDAGIVHRDLKPQNIFLAWEPDGGTVPKLLDFGVAKLLGDSPVHTQSGTPVGTPLYMSPEQARGESVDRRSDVYALGVLCHQLITGALPISGDSTVVVLMGHVLGQPPRASEAFTSLSPELDAPILRMLAKDPNARPATAGRAIADLIEAAERAGHLVPAGLPHLAPPGFLTGETPRHGGDDEHDLSLAEAEMARVAGAGTTTERARRSSDPGVTGRRSGVSWPVFLPVLGALILLGGGGVYFLATTSRRATDAAPPAPSNLRAAGEPSPRSPTGPPPSQAGSAATPTTAPATIAPAAPVIPAPPPVELRVTGAPRGGRVWLDGKLLGETSGPLSLPFGERPVQLIVTAPGHEPVTMTVTPARPVVAAIKMKRRLPAGASRTSVPTDLESPF